MRSKLPIRDFFIKILSVAVLIAVTAAPFLDSVACVDCHFCLFQEKTGKNMGVTDGPAEAVHGKTVSVYRTSLPTQHSATDSNSCPFCIFNIFAVVCPSSPEITFSSTPFVPSLNYQTPLEPVFLETRPPKI
jgi:hypothetical protein